MSNVSILRPKWFDDLDPDDREARRLMNRYLIREAALVATPEGTIGELAKALGVSEQLLTYAYSTRPDRGRITPRVAVKINQLCGDRMPLKLLLPEGV